MYFRVKMGVRVKINLRNIFKTTNFIYPENLGLLGPFIDFQYARSFKDESVKTQEIQLFQIHQMGVNSRYLYITKAPHDIDSTNTSYDINTSFSIQQLTIKHTERLKVKMNLR